MLEFRYGLDWSVTAICPVSSFCAHGSEHSCFVEATVSFSKGVLLRLQEGVIWKMTLHTAFQLNWKADLNKGTARIMSADMWIRLKAFRSGDHLSSALGGISVFLINDFLQHKKNTIGARLETSFVFVRASFVQRFCYCTCRSKGNPRKRLRSASLQNSDWFFSLRHYLENS